MSEDSAAESGRGDHHPTAVDLFCGAGGASLGILDAGFSVTAAIDHAENALATHEHNLDGDTIQHDLADVDPVVLPDTDVDYLHGSPPCKGFSTAGTCDADDPRNTLVWRFIEWVEALDPTVVTMENVPEVTNDERDQRLRARFDELGYAVTWRVLDAADYGVPQHRRRLVLVAVDEERGVSPSLPAPTHGAGTQATLTGDSLTPHRTVGDVLSEAAADGGVVAPNATTPDHDQNLRMRFDALDFGESCDATAKDSQQRLDPAEPAPTVTGQPRDFIHPYEPRVVSVREMARLQSFPDWFEFKGRRTTGGTNRGEDVSQAEQAGNAVPPRLQRAVASHVYTEVFA